MKMVMGEWGGVGNGRETSLTIPLKLWDVCFIKYQKIKEKKGNLIIACL